MQVVRLGFGKKVRIRQIRREEQLIHVGQKSEKRKIRAY